MRSPNQKKIRSINKHDNILSSNLLLKYVKKINSLFVLRRINIQVLTLRVWKHFVFELSILSLNY